VASCKRSLLAVLQERSVTDEVLLTFMKEVASLLKTHFILGCHHPHVPPNVEKEFDGLSRRRWKQVQFIIDQFWRRWMREYVPELIERKKWQNPTRPMRIGDKVLILDENTRRGQWIIGIVSKIFLGDGSIVRRVSVRTDKSELILPVIKLCLISDP
jgi:hypothetical protein